MGMGALIMNPKHFWDMLQESSNQVSRKIERDNMSTSMGSMEDRLDDSVLSKLRALKDKLDN